MNIPEQPSSAGADGAAIRGEPQRGPSLMRFIPSVGAVAVLLGAFLGGPAAGSASPTHADAGPDPSHAVLHLSQRSFVADGHAFGSAGGYEKVVGPPGFPLRPP